MLRKRFLIVGGILLALMVMAATSNVVQKTANVARMLVVTVKVTGPRKS